MIAGFIEDVGKVKLIDTTPARNLGWQPRSPEEAASAGAKSLIEFGIV